MFIAAVQMSKTLALLIGFLSVIVSDWLIYGLLNGILGPQQPPTFQLSSSFGLRSDIAILSLLQIGVIAFFWSKQRWLAVGLLSGFIFVPIFLVIFFFLKLGSALS